MIKDDSLAAAIGDVGRRMSAHNLGLILLGGSIGVVVILWLWRGHRMMAVPLVMPVAFGIWGLAVHGEHALEAQGPDTKVERALLKVVRVTMVAVGAAAAVASMFAITFAVAGQGGLQLR
jgi:hypothetical protein